MDKLFLLGYQDSNLERQDQNLLCYHYTIAQENQTLLSGCKDTKNLRISNKIGYFFLEKLLSFGIPKRYIPKKDQKTKDFFLFECLI